MAVVGDAYIVVKAITTGFERDVRRSLNGINLDADGNAIGESFTRGFTNSISKGLGKKFDFSAAEAAAARQTFQTLVRTNFALTASIGPLISSLGSLGGGFVSLVSIVGAAAPALVVLPGIFTAIGLAAITTVAALKGVGGAVSAGLNQQKKATQENTAAKIAAARRIEDINKRIEKLEIDGQRLERDRIKDLIEAEQDKAEAAIDAAEKEKDAIEDKAQVVEDAAKREKDAIADKASAVQEAALREEEADKRLSLVKEQNTEAMIEANNRLKEAQLDLTEALEAGREEIQQLGFDAEDAALSEKRASITLEKARETLQRTQDLPPNTRARREAQLAFAEAELGLRRAKDKNKDLQKEQDKLAGDPKKTTGYIDALKRQEDAQVNVAQTARDALRAQQEAEANLSSVRASNTQKILEAEEKIASIKIDNAKKIADAEEKITRVKIDNARKIADAEQKYADVKQDYLDREEDLITRIQDAYDDLARAYEDQEKANKGLTGGVDAYANALKGLSPAAQAFVKYLVGTFIPALKKLRDAAAEALLPLLQNGLEKLRTQLFDPLEPMLAKLATSIGTAFNSIIDTIVKPENIKDLEKVFEQSGYIVEGLGKTIGSVYDSILSILVAADPLIRKFTDFLTKKTADFSKFLNAGQASGELEAFFTKAGNIAAQLSGVFGNLFSGISNVISANFQPGGGGYIVLDWLEKITAKFEAFSGSVEGKDSLAEYFKGAATNSIAILESVGAFVKEILKVGADPNVKVFWDTLKEGAPIFGDILKAANEAGPSLARLVVNILKFTKATTDAGAIKIFFNTLNTVLETINTLLENKFIKAIFNATGKVFAFVLALGTIGKIGNFGIKALTGSIDEIGKLVKAIVPAPVLAKVKSGLIAIGNEGAKAFGKVQAGAAAAGSKILELGKDAAGRALSGIKTFAAGSRVLLTSPIFLMAAAIAAIIASLILLYNKVDWFREGVDKAFGAVKNIVTGAFDTIAEIGSKVWDFILSGLKLVWSGVEAYFKTIFAIWKAIVETIIGIGLIIWNFLYDKLKAVWETVSGWWNNTILPFITGVVDKVKQFGAKIWDWLYDKISAVWATVKGFWDNTIYPFFSGVASAVSSRAGAIWNFISGGISKAWSVVTGYFNNTVYPFISSIKTRITSIGAGLWDGLKSGLSGVINFIIGALNKVIGALNWAIRQANKVKIGNDIPPLSLIPPVQLAQGGVISPSRGGTLAVIGEAGRSERVEPLDPDGLSKRDKAMISMLSGGSSGNTFNIYPSQGMNESELASIISRQIAFQLRRGGA